MLPNIRQQTGNLSLYFKDRSPNWNVVCGVFILIHIKHGNVSGGFSSCIHRLTFEPLAVIKQPLWNHVSTNVWNVFDDSRLEADMFFFATWTLSCQLQSVKLLDKKTPPLQWFLKKRNCQLHQSLKPFSRWQRSAPFPYLDIKSWYMILHNANRTGK